MLYETLLLLLLSLLSIFQHVTDNGIHDEDCQIYAVLSERVQADNDVISGRHPARINVTVCGGSRKRKSVAYVTSSNSVDIGFHIEGAGDGQLTVVRSNDDGPDFLIHYEGQQRLVNSLVYR